MTDSTASDDAMARNTPKPSAAKLQNELRVVCANGDDPAIATAVAVIGPYVGNGLALQVTNQKSLGQELALQHYTDALLKGAKAIQGNDLRDIEAMLYAQGLALNAMFYEMSRRAALNMGSYINAAEKYMKLAFKAQNQARMTLETLSNIKNPPVVYARQANINNGGQQQVNNHAHGGKTENPRSKILEHSDEQRMDNGQTAETVTGNPHMEALVKDNRT